MSILFIGLGAMGGPMATNLARGAEPVVVYDVDSAVAHRLATTTDVVVVDSLDPLPAGITTVILMVPDSRVVEDLLTGSGALLDSLPPGALVIDMSSSEPESSRHLAAVAEKAGIAFIDAPVSGGVPRAQTGELAIMTGGAAEVVERATPILHLVGNNVFHVGGPGSGDAAKALNNLLSATNIAATAEILSAAGRFGINPARMLEVINASTSRSQASEFKFPRHVLSGTFDSGFAMQLLLKDLAIARTLTTGAGLDTPVTDAAHTVAQSSRDTLGTTDHTEIARYYESRNHVPLRA
ncbi:NAD(P)-dependent oxidoreductase (plasmid) [Mycolicibacterium psychrotolerans]|uniref:NAD(P)-dependent oxidoreductase n=1 Tax=Mycolicibacterium psychrotolerans TaxID=216929 RepID=UPI003D678FDD